MNHHSCENGIPSGLLYWGKSAFIIDADPANQVKFSILDEPGRQFTVDWGDPQSVWVPCSTVRREDGSHGRLFLSVGWMQANQVDSAPGDPKIPNGLPANSAEYYRIRVVVTGVSLRYHLVEDPTFGGETEILDVGRCLPRFAEPKQVAFEAFAEGDLWLTEAELDNNGLTERAYESRVWPDPLATVDLLLREGVVAVDGGRVAYRPKDAQDVHRLCQLLILLEAHKEPVEAVFASRAAAAAAPARGAAPPRNRRKP